MLERPHSPLRIGDLMKGAEQNDEINQTKCWIATHGWRWMREYFDCLPLRVRRRLQDSPFNLGPACLVTEFLPKVQSQHPEYAHERALLAAIDDMELQLRDEVEMPNQHERRAGRAGPTSRGIL